MQDMYIINSMTDPEPPNPTPPKPLKTCIRALSGEQIFQGFRRLEGGFRA